MNISDLLNPPDELIPHSINGSPKTVLGQKRKRTNGFSVDTRKPDNVQTADKSSKRFKCKQCSYTSTHRANVTKHLRIHTGVKSFKCEQCTYATYNISNLITHRKRHTEDKSFKCKQCDYTTKYGSALITHIRKHTGVKPFKCQQCDYATANKSNLTVHMRKHTGEQPYKCNQCNYAAKQKSHLIQHVRTHKSNSTDDSSCTISKRRKQKIHMNSYSFLIVELGNSSDE